MNEQERADVLARAIDELIQAPPATEPSFEDEELRSLLRVARARLGTGADRGREAANHEAAVWQRVVARLEAHETPGVSDPESMVPEDDMRGVISARRKMTDDSLQLAEQHRDEVWRRLQERINQKRPKERGGIFSFLKSSSTNTDTTGEPPVSRTRIIPTGDSDLDSLLKVALGHTTLRTAGERSMTGTEAQIRARMRHDPGRYVPPISEDLTARRGGWIRATVAAAFIGSLVALLGPIPATGFADSPAGQAVEFVGEHLGVTETAQTPPASLGETQVAGQDVTAADAAARTGLPLTAPATLLGMSLATQRLFESGVTSSGPTFYASYMAADGSESLAVYEEPSAGSNLAVATGSAVDVVVGGSPATYFVGGWSEVDDGVAWAGAQAQSLVFERSGVRFTLTYTGPAIDLGAFISAAEALIPAA